MTSPENIGADWLGFRFSDSFAGLRPLGWPLDCSFLLDPLIKLSQPPQGARGHNGDSCCFGLLPLKHRSCRPPKDGPKTDAEELINKHPIYRSRRAFRLRLIRSQTGQAQRKHNLCNANRRPRDATEPGYGRASDKRAQL
jgi:hypothetical protein